MVEMQLENERVERLGLQQLGEGWIRAITEKAFERLEASCQPGVVSHLLTPYNYRTLDNVKDLVAKLQGWFGDCSDFRIEHSRVERIGERLGISYRLLVQEQAAWQRIEQQIFCTLQDGRIAEIHLLCSGFQPVSLGEQDSPGRDALLEFHSDPANRGSTCAVLTPAIKMKLREMDSGQVLEVRVDDPDARQDIEAWCRLSGNALVGMQEIEGAELRFFVKKK